MKKEVVRRMSFRKIGPFSSPNDVEVAPLPWDLYQTELMEVADLGVFRDECLVPFSCIRSLLGPLEAAWSSIDE